MIFVPSRRMLGIIAALCLAALALVIFPESWLLLLTANVVVLLAAGIDLAITPRPSALKVVRRAPERLSVMSEQSIVLLVRNTSPMRLSVRVRDGVPTALGQSDIECGGLVPASGETQWEYTVKPRSRGRFAWGPISIRYRSLLGLWAPGVTPRLFNLDITLKGCRFEGLNRRYAGTLMATFADNSAQFSLAAYALPIPGQPVSRYDVGATLRR